MGRVLSGVSLTFLIMASLTFSTAVAQVGVSYNVDVAVELLDEDFYAGVDKNGSGPADGARIAFGGSSSNDGQRIAFIAFDRRQNLAPIIENGFVGVANFLGEDPETWDRNANGTPDIEEIRCFTLLLATDALPPAVLAAYDFNRDIALVDVGPSPSLAGLPNLFAFYMTLGDPVSAAIAPAIWLAMRCASSP